MASILKVDTLQKPDGSTPTAADLGIIHKAGDVVQTITAKPTTTTTFSSGSYTDAAGFSVDITPKYANSLIVIRVFAKTSHLNGTLQTAQDHRIVRNGTQIYRASWQNYFNRSHVATDIYPPFVTEFIDSPSTTNQLTYSIQGCLYGGNQGPWNVNDYNGGDNQAVMTVTEIKQ